MRNGNTIRPVTVDELPANYDPHDAASVFEAMFGFLMPEGPAPDRCTVTREELEARIAARDPRVSAVCRRWEQIIGAPLRYRIDVQRGRVWIAQFWAPGDCPSVEFGPGKMIRLDPGDMARVAKYRGVTTDALYFEVVAFCEALLEQYNDLSILDTSEY